MYNKKYLSFTSFCLASSLAVPAMAQLEEIVVTAQKREENVQDVPIAISAFTGENLAERAVTNVDGLSNLTPNVTLDGGTPFSGSSSVLSAFIRGIGSNDFAFNIDPGVGVYIDGVYLARTIGANQDLMDVERIEVLKGPQGTLFGRNTIGGAISIVTREPGDEFSFEADVTLGSYELMQIRGFMDIPLTDSLKSSLSFSSKDREGHLSRRRYPGVGDLNTEALENFPAAGYGDLGQGQEGGDDMWSARYKLVFDNDSSFRAAFSADYTNIDQMQLANTVMATSPAVFAGAYNCAIAGIDSSGCAAGMAPEGYINGIGGYNGLFDMPALFGVNVDDDPTNDRLPYDDRFLTGDVDESYANGNNFTNLENWGVGLTLDYQLSDNMALKSISSYRKINWVVGMDLDGSPLNFLHTSFTTDQEQYSQEFQLTGTALNDKLEYVLGAYYFVEDGSLHDYVTFAEGLLQVDGLNLLRTENYAFFSQFDYRITDRMTLTLGGRFTSEDKEFEGAQGDNNGLNYKLANVFGDPNCASLDPISDACRASLGFPNADEPLRYYVDGKQTKSFEEFSPKIGLSYELLDDIMIYTTYSEGYKTGGWTTRLSNPLPYAPDFDEEVAKTFEVGLKSTLLDNTLQLNMAVFQTDYEGIQLNFQQGVSPVLQNAGDAEIKGLEVEAMWAPTNSFTLNVGAGYLDSEYTRIDDGAVVPGNADQGGVVVGGDLPKTPDFKFNISPRYEWTLGDKGSLVVLADYTHTAEMWNDTERTYLLEREATDVVNMSITYREPDDNWYIMLGGTNLTDERYPVTGQAQIAGGMFYGTYSRPEEYYLRVGMKM